MIIMRRTIKALRHSIKMLKNKNNDNNDKYQEAINSIFNEEQVNSLIKKKRVRNWSNKTIQRALKLKFTCGVNGYQELLDQGIPLPSIRTLSRKLEDLKFLPGISNDMLEFLKYKKSSFNNGTDIECGIVFDEMAITPKQRYNPATGQLVGDITFPGKKGTATKALVFMLVGIGSRWKHIIAYHFTGNSFDSNILKDIVFQIIHETGKLGFHVNFITCDMSSGNTSLWKILGISTGRYTKMKNYIVHPSDPTRNLFIIADPPHILKNLKQALINNEFMTVSDDIMVKYNLPSNKIELEYFKDLIQVQENSELLLTPKLNMNDFKPNNFAKMKVNKAKNLFSQDVSSSFKLVAAERNQPEFLSTAWFVQIVSKWFTLMTSRFYKVALGKNNNDIYEDNINFLHKIINIFTNLQIGTSGFKPVQRGIMISTQSVIDLTEYLIVHRNFKYVFTVRFTQDCVENLFSQIRLKNVVPNPLQFIHDLRIISIAMYMKDLRNSNYEQDDGEYLSEFLEYLDNKKTFRKSAAIETCEIYKIADIPPFIKNVKKLSIFELNSL